MLDCIKFLLSCTVKFISLLFSIDVGFTNLGTIFCVINILFPIMLLIVGTVKHQVFVDLTNDFNDWYNEDNKKDNKKYYKKKGRKK